MKPSRPGLPALVIVLITKTCVRLERKLADPKSTCKDRWRQVLAEAEKVSRKHLLTLEPGISEPQTDQMEASSLQLVVPAPVHGS
ncbi:type II restriction endonuclease [Pseudophaeobacter arcticus]|uniref:type II restriction endonuclease n=1 Tax=Pseudophaeobacter arcticus TaxID=385492 RepID=UPI000487CA4A